MRKFLPVFGVAYAVGSIMTDLIASSYHDDYNYFDQAISELSAIGSALAPSMLVLLVLNATLLTGFGCGVWQRAGVDARLRRAGVLIIALGLSHLAWPFFPMHARGELRTWSDTGHLAVTAATVTLIIATIWSASSTQTRWFHRYSLATIAVLLVAGAATTAYVPRVAANLPTPWMGLVERINYYGFMLWVGVFAVMLWRQPDVMHGAGASAPRWRSA